MATEKRVGDVHTARRDRERSEQANIVNGVNKSAGQSDEPLSSHRLLSLSSSAFPFSRL